MFFTWDTCLAVHKDVKANPKHLEEVPVVGSILHKVPGKPGGMGRQQKSCLSEHEEETIQHYSGRMAGLLPGELELTLS